MSAAFRIPAHPALGELKRVALLAFWTLTPRAALRLLPGSSLRFGPPRRWARTADHLRASGDEWRPVLPARVLRLPPMFLPEDGLPPLVRRPEHALSERGVALLRNTRIFHEAGWPVAPGDVLLPEFCSYSGHRMSLIYRTLLSDAPVHLPGRTLNLCSAHAGYNFNHWLLDAVARLAYARAAGFAWADLDHVVLPRFPGETARIVTGALGIPEGKWVRPSRTSQFLCDVLVQPSNPGECRCYPPEVVAFHRSLLPPAAPAGPARLYLARRGNRGIENEAEIEAQLVARGFVEADPTDFPRLRSRLAAATHIVGVHGAALANLVHARPGARLLELIPTSNPWPYFRSLCAGAGIGYGALLGRSRRHAWHPHGRNPNSPFHVCPRAFAAALDALLAA